MSRAEPRVIELFTLQIIDKFDDFGGMDIDAATLDKIVAEAEENITDLLPPGCRARIRRWNQPDNEGNDDE